MTATPEELGKFLFEMFEDSTFYVAWDSLTPAQQQHWAKQAQAILHAYQYGVPGRPLRHPY